MKQAGFTLLELLVALVVLGFILGGLVQGVRYGLRATDTQARLSEGRGELDAVDRALRRLIAQADPGTAHGGPSLAGTGSRLLLTSDLPDAAGPNVGQADIAIAVAPDHRLVLRWTPHLHATRFGPAPAPHEVALLENVDRIELAYWAGGWRGTWDAAGLPALIRLRIVFPAGDDRHWPDLVAAPQRMRSG